MNFADAIRQAAQHLGSSALPSETPGAPQGQAPRAQNDPTPVPSWNAEPANPAPEPARPHLELVESKISTPEPANEIPPRIDEEPEEVEEAPFAFDAVTASPVEVPSTHLAPLTGNVVRLELFLTPEQLNSLFRAVVATQHSVMTLREAAAYLRISPSRLETMAQEGQIPAFLIDGRWRFARNSVDEWLNMQSLQKEMEA